MVENELDLEPSKNPYDWLGDGIYFFEGDLERARRFAEQAARFPERRLSSKPIVLPYAIGAIIHLGHCLDLSTQRGVDEFSTAYEDLVKGMGPDQELPINKCASASDQDYILHNLDRAVINFVHGKRMKNGDKPYDTVRGFFRQGDAVMPTSAFGRLSHVQIAVRNKECILGYFHPRSPDNDPFMGLSRIPPLPYKKKKLRASGKC